MSNTPQIRFAGFTDAWEQRKLGEVAVEVKRKAEKDSVAPVMMISASDGFIDQSQRYSTDNAGSSLKNYTLLYEGELAYNHGYSKVRNFGSVFDLKVKEARIPFVYHSFALPEDDHCFFAYYLNSGLFDGELKKLVSSTARMDGLLNISFDDYMSLEILRPSKAEQEKIGSYLTNLDNLITLHQRKCDALQKFKKSMLQKMFPQNGESVPEIRFAGFTDAWEQRKLGEVFETVTDYVAAGSFADIAKNVQYQSEKGYARLVRTVDLKAKFHNSDFVYVNKNAFEYLYRVNLDKECIILPNVGVNCGEVYYVEPSTLVYERNVLGPNAVYIRSENSNNKFLSAEFETDDFKNNITVIVASSGQPKFNKTELKSIVISIPTRPEQDKIADYFTDLDNLITLHQRELDGYKKLKKAMLQKMFV